MFQTHAAWAACRPCPLKTLPAKFSAELVFDLHAAVASMLIGVCFKGKTSLACALQLPPLRKLEATASNILRGPQQAASKAPDEKRVGEQSVKFPMDLSARCEVRRLQIVDGDEVAGENGLQLDVRVVNEAGAAGSLCNGHEARRQHCLVMFTPVSLHPLQDELCYDVPHPHVLILQRLHADSPADFNVKEHRKSQHNSTAFVAVSYTHLTLPTKRIV